MATTLRMINEKVEVGADKGVAVSLPLGTQRPDDEPALERHPRRRAAI